MLATNPNAEGDATAHFLIEALRPTGVRLSRIAFGMPLGGDLEYADHVTVGMSVENRRIALSAEPWQAAQGSRASRRDEIAWRVAMRAAPGSNLRADKTL